jgi:hypothetical protein
MRPDYNEMGGEFPPISLIRGTNPATYFAAAWTFDLS